MELANQIIPLAIDMIDRFGSDITLVRPSETSYNVDTGKTETIAGDEIILKGVIESYTSEEVQGLVQVGDIKIMLANDNLIIDMTSDKIKFNNVLYNIINVEPLYLNNEIMIYTLQVRR